MTTQRDIDRAELVEALAAALADANAAHDLQAHGRQHPAGYEVDDCLRDIARRVLRTLGPWAANRPRVVHDA